MMLTNAAPVRVIRETRPEVVIRLYIEEALRPSKALRPTCIYSNRLGRMLNKKDVLDLIDTSELRERLQGCEESPSNFNRMPTYLRRHFGCAWGDLLASLRR